MLLYKSLDTNKRVITLVALFLLSLLLLVKTSIGIADTSPSIVSPRLSYLDTNNGLNQDSINDIHVDKQGFVWLATDEGLNRFDGSKIKVINGDKLQLAANTVYKIVEHSNGLFYLSTVNGGVLSLNRDTLVVETVLLEYYGGDNAWLQSSDAMYETSDNNMLIALNESIYVHDVNTKQNTKLWELNDEHKAHGNYIRSAYLHENVLLIGTRDGFYALNLINQKVYDLFAGFDLPIDAVNTKFLHSYDKQNLLIGTVQGLYKYSLGEILKHVNEQWKLSLPRIISDKRNIWDIALAKNNKAYVATDIGMYSLDLNNLDFDYLFQPRKNIEILSSLDIRTVALDRHDNLWMGTRINGAMYWSSSSLLFNNTFNSIYTKNSSLLSNNEVWAIHQKNPDTLYVGTINGLNKVNLQSGEIERYFVQDINNAQYSEFNVYQIDSKSQTELWLNTGAGIRIFDTKTNEYSSLSAYTEEIQNIFNTFTYSFQKVSDSYLWLINDDGVFIVDLQNNTSQELSLDDYGLSLINIHSFLGLDEKSNQVIVGASTSVWGVDLNTLTFTQLHSIANETSDVNAFSGDYLRGVDNSIWVSYPGYGLYKLDSETYRVKAHYSRDNLLPTNIVYGLMQDNSGILWFSSHSGIHSLDPKSNKVRKYGFIDGLASAEFNQSAFEKLSNGQLIYGGNLGFTRFSPRKLKQSELDFGKSMAITEFTVSNRELNLPITSLNGHTIDLNHNDVGLSIYFSSLDFDLLAEKRYQYRIISNGEVVNYPINHGDTLTISMLKPGRHLIEIFRPNSIPDEGAKLFVKVSYPRFASPLAYFIYAVFAAILLIVLLIRYKHKEHLLSVAQQQSSEYQKRVAEGMVAAKSNVWEWHEKSNSFIRQAIVTDKAQLENESQLAAKTLSFDEYLVLIHPSDQASFVKKWQQFLHSESLLIELSYRIKSKTQDYLWCRDIGRVYHTDNTQRCIKGTCTQLSHAAALQERQKLLGRAIQHSQDWLLVFSDDKELLTYNNAFSDSFISAIQSEPQIANSEQQELVYRITKQFGGLRAGQTRSTETIVNLKGKQKNYLFFVKAISFDDDPNCIESYLVTATDITGQVSKQKELQKLASYDVLTGLINRTLLLETLRQSISFSKRNKVMCATFIIGLDKFKPINERYGHISGDIILTEIAQRLHKKFREQDSVARLEGDEFVLVLSDIKTTQSIDNIAKDVLALISEEIIIGKYSAVITGSIGVALYPEDAQRAEDLLENAGLALSLAKQEGSNRFCYYKQTKIKDD